MLQTIREKLTGWFAVFILGAIALTLVVTFGNIDTGFSPLSAAATVNGEDITQRDFQMLYRQQRQQWETSYRMQLPDALAEDMANSVIQSLVRNRVVAQHVRDQGYRVSDDEVVAAISGNTAFFVGGQFSQPAYEQLLGSQGISQQRYEYEQRQGMEISQFVEGIGYTAFFTPAEFRRYIELEGETRDMEYVTLAAGTYRDKVSIDAEKIAAYYEQNKDDYRTEESAAVEFIEVNYDQLAAEIEVGLEDAKEYYESNQDEFRGPDERLARHILISTADDAAAAADLARELKQRLDSGESYEELAAEYSADTGTAGSGGELGWLGAGDSPAAEFEDALFALQEGEVSEPVETEFGFHLIRLDGVRSGNAQEFVEVQDELLARLREDAATDIYAELVDELDDRALESLDGLQPVAEGMGLELQTVPEFTRGGGEPLGYSPQLIDTVFSLEVLEDGENSPVIEVEEGRAVVVHVTGYRESEVKPLEAVSEEITAQLQTDESILLAAKDGNELLAGLNDGGDAAELLAARGLEWQRQDKLGRGAAELPADLAAEIFRVSGPEEGNSGEYRSLMLASGDFAVYRITRVSPGQPGQFSLEDRNQRKEQLAGRLGGGQASAVVEALVESAAVTIVPDLLGTENDLL